MTLVNIKYEIMRQRRLAYVQIVNDDFTSFKYKKGLELASQEFRIIILHKLYKKRHPITYITQKFGDFIKELNIQCTELKNGYNHVYNNYMGILYELS